MTTGKWRAALSKRFDSYSWRSNNTCRFCDSNWWNFQSKMNQTQFPLVTNLWKWWRKRHFEIVVEEIYKDKWTQRRSAQDWLGGTCGEHVLCFPFSFASNSPPAQLFSLYILAANCVEHPQRGVCIGGAGARQYSTQNTHPLSQKQRGDLFHLQLARCNEKIMPFSLFDLTFLISKFQCCRVIAINRADKNRK